MKYFLTETKHFDFFQQLDIYKSEIESFILSNNPVHTEYVNSTILNIKEYIISHISPNSDTIIDILDAHYTIIDDYITGEYGLGDKLKNQRNRLQRFSKGLSITINYLSIIDTLINPEIRLNIETAAEKSDYLLSKLNILFSDEMYSATLLFELNDIKLRNNEGREIIEDLQRRGYAILKERYSSSDYVKISVKGASYIERKNKAKNKTVADIELNKKLDNIIEHLTKLGYGQEIIFNEIDELRNLQNKLPKKSWKQLLKGKLIDLVIDKLIDVDTANSVYEYITQSSFKLLK